MKLPGNPFRALCLVMALAVFLTACGGGQNVSSPTPGTSGEKSEPAPQAEEPKKEKVTLKIMFQKNDANNFFHDWMQENIKLFKQNNPHIDFEVTANTCCDNYLTVVTTQMAANNLPDIFQGWTLERMRPFAEAGRLYDLSQAIDADPQWKQNFPETAFDATKFNNGIYGIPLEQAAEVVFYNKEVFEKLGLKEPQTYDEFLNIVDVLKNNNIIPMTVPNKEPWVGSIPYMTILERIGGLEAYQKTVIDKTAPWTDEPFIQAGVMLQDLMNRGAFEKNVNSITMKESEIKLAEGRAGMYMMGTWSVPALTKSMGDKLGFFNFPDIPGGKGSKDHFILLPNSSLSIAAGSKHPEEALAFLKFVFSQERQLEYAKMGYLTTFKTQVNPGDLPKFNEGLLSAISKGTGKMYPWDVPLGVFMGKELNNTTQSLYTGVNPKEAFTKLQKTADSQVKK